MTRVILCRESQVLPFSSWLDTVGVSSAPLLRRAGVSADPGGEPDRWIAELPIWQLAEQVTRSQGIEDFGLRVGIQTEVPEIGAFGRALAGAATLGTALASFFRDVNLHSTSADFGLRSEGEFVWLWRRGIPGFASDPIEQYVLGLMVQIVRMAAGPGWAPDRVLLRADELPGDLAAEVFSEARVQLGAPMAAVRFPSTHLSRTIRSATDGDADTVDCVPADAPPMDLPGSLRLAIAAVMRDATPSLDWAADVAGVSSRTLRRRLDAIGLSWSGLIAQTRFNAARRLLETNDLEIRDIAREVGYSDPANFTRAFRRWTGEAPSAYRERS